MIKLKTKLTNSNIIKATIEKVILNVDSFVSPSNVKTLISKK